MQLVEKWLAMSIMAFSFRIWYYICYTVYIYNYACRSSVSFCLTYTAVSAVSKVMNVRTTNG